LSTVQIGITLIGLLTHLIRDLSYLWVDPRVKYFD